MTQTMKIQRKIDEIIQAGKERGKIPGFTECHHIKMRSLGGSDEPHNLVHLLMKEHYEIHKLYYKRNPLCYKSASAFTFMSDKERIQSGEEYEAARKLIRKTLHERNGWLDNRLWHPQYGIITIDHTFVSNDFAETYIPNTNPNSSGGNIRKVLLGRTPHTYKKTWRLADTGLYKEVLNRCTIKFETIWITNESINLTLKVERINQNEFYKEFGMRKGAGRLQELFAQKCNTIKGTKGIWRLATQEEIDDKRRYSI